MASTSFRESINSLGWSRRDQDLPANTSQTSGLMSSLRGMNPFGSSGGYLQLPTTESAGAPLPQPSRQAEEEGWFACESLRSSISSVGAPPMPPQDTSPAAGYVHEALSQLPCEHGMHTS